MKPEEEVLVELRRFDSVHEAALAASALETRGIDCEMKNGYVMGVHPELATATGGVTLLVRGSEAESARAILDADAPAAEGDESTSACAGCGRPLEDPLSACPDCNGHPDRNIKTPRRTYFAIVKLKLWIVVITLAIIVAPMLFERVWYRIVELPEKSIVTALWSAVAIVAGVLVLKAFSASDSRL